MIVNANDLCRTRLCRGHLCTEEAEPYKLVCSTCDRKRRAGRPWQLHVTPPNLPDDLLCSCCGQTKPDDEFSPNPSKHRRRYRHGECKQCQRERARAARAVDREGDNAKLRDRRARRKARLQAEVNTQAGV